MKKKWQDWENHSFWPHLKKHTFSNSILTAKGWLKMVSIEIVKILFYFTYNENSFCVKLICTHLYALCEKSLISPSEWRTAVFVCGSITRANNNTSPHRRGLSFVYLDLTFVSSFSVQHDEDLRCTKIFAIGIKFAFGSTTCSTVCDLLLII